MTLINTFEKFFSCLVIAVIISGTSVAQEMPLLLTNGKVVTLNANNQIANSVLIHKGEILAIDDLTSDLAKSAEQINLDGRTVIPGLYDSHMHFIRATLRPGYDCLLYTSPSPRDRQKSRMPSSA